MIESFKFIGLICIKNNSGVTYRGIMGTDGIFMF